LTRKNPSPYDL